MFVRQANRALLMFAVAAALADSVGAQKAATCSVETRAAGKLRLDDGRAAYVEPMAFLHTAESAVLAGEPMYVWSAGAYSSGLGPDHDLLGVQLTARGVSALPKPGIDGIVTHVRLAADGNGYAAVFAVTDSSSASGRYEEVVLSYWFGRSDGREWTALERLPMPSGPLHARRASDLVRVGSEWLLAIPFVHGTEVHVAVYSRSVTGWRIRAIPTFAADYVVLTERRGTPDLYVVHPDTIPPDGNSFWLYSRHGSDWQLREHLLKGGTSPIHFPAIASDDASRVMTWIRADRNTGAHKAFAARIDEGGLLGPAHLLANDVGYWDVIRGRASRPAWVIGSVDSTGAERMTFLEWEGNRPVIRDIIANPFTGLFLGAILKGEPAAIGPLFAPADKEEPLVSGILRFERRCHSAVPETP